MRKFGKFALSLVLLAVAVVGAMRFRDTFSESARWEALSKQRRTNEVDRVLPPFQTYLQQLTFSKAPLETMYELSFDAYADNYTHRLGILNCGGTYAGQCSAHLFYRGWQAEPDSAAFSITLEPSILPSLKGPEILDLIARTPKQGQLRTKLGDIDWTSRFDEKGAFVATFQVAYPCRWMNDIPDMEHGFGDEARADLQPRVLRFLRREAFASAWQPVALALPSFNPPGMNPTEPVWSTWGYMRTKNNHLVPISISTSTTTSWPHRTTVEIDVPGQRPDFTNSASEQDIAEVFKPEFLKAFSETPGTASFKDGLSLYNENPGAGHRSLHIMMPLEYPFETGHLTPIQ